MKTLFSLTLAALAGSTTVAFAESYFTLSHVQERDSIVELGTIASDSDGVVQVFSYHGGEKGPMLGWKALHAGANSKVRVPLASTPRTSGVTELVVDGRVVATQAIRFDD